MRITLAGLAQQTLQPIPVLVEIDGRLGDAAFHGRLGYRRGFPDQHPVVERLGDQIFGSEFQTVDTIGLHHGIGDILLGQAREGAGCSPLHLFVDASGPYIQGPPKDEGKAQHIVDLIREVGATCGHDHIRARSLGVVVGDLRFGNGHGEDDRVVVHTANHLRADTVGGRESDKHVGTSQSLGERSHISVGAQLLFVGIHPISRPRKITPAVSQRIRFSRRTPRLR